MTDYRRKRADRIQRRAKLKCVRAFFGDMLCFDVAVASSTFGWLPHFTGIPLGCFLSAVAVLGLVFASFVRPR